MTASEPKPIKLVIVIINRNLDKKVTELLNDNGIKYHVAMPGKGTASTEIKSYFGLEEKEKTVILSVVEEDKVNGIFTKFKEDLNFGQPDAGIAFTIKISSLSNMLVLQYLTGMLENKEDN